MIRNSVTRGICALVALGLTLPVAAAPKAKASKAKADPMMYCPMMDISVKKSKTHKSMVKGKTYYMCCKKCKASFDKNPTKNAKEFDEGLAEHKKAQKKG